MRKRNRKKFLANVETRKGLQLVLVETLHIGIADWYTSLQVYI